MPANIGIDRIDFRIVGSHSGRLAHGADASVPQFGLEQLSQTPREARHHGKGPP